MSKPNKANLDRFSGMAAVYDAYRPRTPAVLLNMLTQLAGEQRPRLVVDLGSGTGLSTFIWADRAESVIGLEPNDDMRGQAENQQPPDMLNVHFRAASSSETGLAAGCADIVTCSQALHWMERDSTFAEVVRILRPGGVFAAYDYLWPPTMHWEAEAALATFLEHGKLAEKQRIPHRAQPWPKEEHLPWMQASGHFRYVRQVWMHSVEMGDAARLVGIALSDASVGALRKLGMSDAELGLDRLREVAERTLGDQPVPWYFSYSVRLGIK
jgi:SAM-dependent methyltransferase